MAGYVDRGFYDLISEYVEQNIKKMGPQHLADIAFGASAGGCVTERMQSAIEKVSLEFVQQADMRVGPIDPPPPPPPPPRGAHSYMCTHARKHRGAYRAESGIIESGCAESVAAINRSWQDVHWCCSSGSAAGLSWFCVDSTSAAA